MFDLGQRVEELCDGTHREDALGIRLDLERVQSAGITTMGELIDAVNDATRDLEVRGSACSLLAWLGEIDAAPALERAFEEAPDGGLVWETAQALERLRAQRAAPVLVRVLKEGTTAKQAAAAWLLGLLRVQGTVAPLWLVAMDRALDEDVRGHAIEALGLLQAKEAVPDLITLLSDPAAELRYWAAYALGQIGDPASIPALEQMARVDTAVQRHGFSLREEALDALESIRGAHRDDS